MLSGLLCVSLADVHSQPYLWTTIAGSTILGSADGTNTGAQFRGPSGLTLDTAGAMWRMFQNGKALA
jgi:hypothetical protein